MNLEAFQMKRFKILEFEQEFLIFVNKIIMDLSKSFLRCKEFQSYAAFIGLCAKEFTFWHFLGEW